METQKIKAILSAAKHKSLSKAAAEVSYTPSAMSHIADAIERELGVKILTRTPLGVTLTEEGEALYERMVALVEAENALVETAHALAEAKACLRIGVLAGVSQGALHELIDAFRAVHPEIRISMVEEDDLSRLLADEGADVIFLPDHTVDGNEWVPTATDMRADTSRGFAFRRGAAPTHAAKEFINFLEGERTNA